MKKRGTPAHTRNQGRQVISCKRSQMQISFGIIWAIILIVAFIAFAFYAVQKFLGMQRTLEVGGFANDFQEDIDRIWKSSKASQEVSYALPSKIEKICFIDYYSSLDGKNKEIGENLRQVFYETENVFFYPIGSAEGLDAMAIKHLDIEKITESENPKCFENSGKVEFIIKKDYSNPLVVIE